MPDPLQVRVLDGLKAAALAVTPQVPPGRAYRRGALEYAADRDGAPALVVAPTPGGRADRRALFGGRAEVTYPATVLLVDAKGANPSLPADWRAGWADALSAALGDDFPGSASAPAEVIDVRGDGTTLLDLAPYEAAGLWASAVPVVVVCRLPAP